jgi:hypothetical protein
MNNYFEGDITTPRERVTSGVPVITTNHSLIHEKRAFELSGTFAAAGTNKPVIVFNPPAAAKATAAIVMTDTDANLLYTFNETGFQGNDWKVTHANPSGNSKPLLVSVAGTTITVSLATNSGGTIISTAAQVAAAVNASDAGEYVTCTVPGTGGTVNAVSEASFSGGAKNVYIHFQAADITAAAAVVVVRVIEGATFTGTAATLTPINKSRIRPLHPTRAAITHTLNATVTTTSATVLETVTARGNTSGQVRTAITKANDDEWVFEPGRSYMFEFAPAAATASDYRFFWYEEDGA